MLVSPAPTITSRPSLGLSAETKKLWNTFCRMKKGLAARIIRAYSTQYSSISPSAPSAREMGRASRTPAREMTAPPTAEAATSREKYWLASSGFPSPIVLATIALPPVPTMKPRVPRIIMTGYTRFRAAKGVLPTKLDTNRPSTTL